MTAIDPPPLRQLAEAATPGPWTSLVHGTASQRDAAGRAYEAVMAVHAADDSAHEIEFTDLPWVDLPDGVHVALVGNGPSGPENAHYIAAVSPDVTLALLDNLAARDREVAALRGALSFHNETPAGRKRTCLPGCIACAALATPSTEEAGS